MATSTRRTVEFEFLVRDREAVKSLRNIEDETRRTGKGFSQMGNLVKAAISGVAIREIGQFVWEAAQAASDVEESTNAIGRVFGEAAGEVEAFGDTAAEQVGLSKAQFQGLAAETGALLTGLGFDVEDAADKTLLLTGRASDMASVFNTDVETAVRAIGSALKGERDPIERFGVALNESKVQAKALELGLAETKGEIDATDKALASIELILEQTDTVAGDFLETSDGLANSQRILKARIEDTRAEIGQRLLPIMADATSAVNEFIVGIDALADDSLTGFERAAVVALEGARAGFESLDTKARDVARAIVKDYGDAGNETEEFGQKVEDLFGVFADNEGFWDGFARVLPFGDWGTTVGETEEALIALFDQMGLTAEEALLLRDNVDTMTDALGLSEEEAGAFQSALDRAMRDGTIPLREDMDRARKGTDNYREAMARLRGETEETTGRIAEQSRKIDENAQAHLDALNPVKQYRDAQQKLDEKLQEVIRLQAEGKEGTEEYRDAVWEAVEAQGELNAAEQGFIDNKDAGKEAFEELARQAGIFGSDLGTAYQNLALINQEIGKLPPYLEFPTAGGGTRRVRTGAGTRNDTRARVNHQGGTVPGAPGTEVLTMLKAGEKVLPVVPSPSSGGGHSITVNVSGGSGDGQQLAREIARRLEWEMRLAR